MKVVLAYSGGLDTSVIIPWLRETYNAEVIAFIADVGQEDDYEYLREKAIKSGAKKVYVEDLKDEFIRDYIFPTMRASAVYEDKYLLGTSFARPLIAKYQVQIAEKEGAEAVSHGSTGKGNDQVRFELTYMALNPKLQLIAPWKDDKWPIKSREDALAYAQKHNIPITMNKNKIYSEDRNIWHISHEGCELEDPWQEPKDLWSISSSLEAAPNEAEYLELDFEKGTPISFNNKKLSPFDLLRTLNQVGGKHAIGHVDIVENRLVGMKSRGVYETPGGTILYEAHRALETLVLDKATYHFKQQIALKYAEMVYNGEWFSPLKDALDAFINETQKHVTGKVKIKLYKGNVVLAGVKSPYSLYSEELATFAEDLVYDQKDAKGFIKLFGLPLKTYGLKHRSK